MHNLLTSDATSGFGLLAALHALVSILIAWIAVLRLPADHRGPPAASFAFVASFAFFVPVLGALSVIAGFVLAKRLPRQRRSLIWHTTRRPDLPVAPVPAGDRRVYTAGGLVDVLRHAASPEKRMRAVVATRQLPHRQAVPILRLGLRDPADDVRLFAYALLDGKDGAINSRIDALRTDATGEGDHRARHARLAAEYWELSYLGLSQGRSREHCLERAWAYAGEALDGRHVGAMQLLRGRTALAQGRLHAARDAFLAAEEHGIAAAATAPYLAELAYRERRFEQVPRYLRRVTKTARRKGVLADVVACWT